MKPEPGSSSAFHLYRKFASACVAFQFHRDPVIPFVVTEFGQFATARLDRTALHV